MNKLTKTLFAGAALCALAAVPAIAEGAPTFHITALHGGRVVNKTKMHNHGATHITYTFGAYTYVSASTPLRTKISGVSAKMCPGPQKVTLSAKKTVYGKVKLDFTYSDGCETITPIYKLVKQPNPGDTDEYEVIIISKFEQNGTKYKGTFNMDYNLDFE